MKTRNLSDFALFLSVMKNREAYENVLSIILNEPDLELLEVQVENVVLNENGKRAIRRFPLKISGSPAWMKSLQK